MDKRITLIFAISLWVITALLVGQSIMLDRALQKDIQIQKNMRSGMA